MSAQPDQMGFDFARARRQRRGRTVYWITTPLPRAELREAIDRAAKQDEAVIAIFRAAAGPLAPSQVHQTGIDNGRKWLIQSVRRSMTNLSCTEVDGEPIVPVLLHLEATRMGPHGSSEGLWMLNPARGSTCNAEAPTQ